MIWLLAGFGLLLLGLLGIRAFNAADPVKAAKWLRFGGGGALMLLAGALALTGRMLFAAPLAGWAWLLLRARPSLAGPEAEKSAPGSRPRNKSGMSQAEALEILGLQPGAAAEEIRAAHRRLMQTCHPDHGGSSYLAARINAAKDVLLSS